MSTPAWQLAAERLRTTCPVRTHAQREEKLAAGDRRGRQFIPPQHKAGRPVRVRGRKYESVSAAARAMHVHAREIYKWLRTGKASYDK